MLKFKIYEDAENVKPPKRQKTINNKRQVLGEIKNVVETNNQRTLGVSDGMQKRTITKNGKISPKSKNVVNSKIPVFKRRNGNKPSISNKKTSLGKRRKLSDILKVTDYVDEIYAYLHYLEIKYEITEKPQIKEKFKDRTRLALLDWFAEVHEYTQMSQETFQLSVSIMDRYLHEDETIQKFQLQLVALGSIFISSKYEDIFPVDLSELIFVSDNAYTEEEILSMEMNIVGKLNFNFGQPVAVTFVRRYANIVRASRSEQFLAFYFTDLALLSYELCYLRPSLLAAIAFYVALCVSNEMIDQALWDSRLIEQSTYRLPEFIVYIPVLADLVIRTSTSKYEALKRKYSRPAYLGVSNLSGLAPETGIINEFIII